MLAIDYVSGGLHLKKLRDPDGDPGCAVLKGSKLNYHKCIFLTFILYSTLQWESILYISLVFYTDHFEVRAVVFSFKE